MPMPLFAKLLLLVFTVGVGSGCATKPPVMNERAALSTVAQALQVGDCAGATTQLESMPDAEPQQLLQAAQVCLQLGEFAPSRALARRYLDQAQFGQDTDYAAYLHALAGFGAWNRDGSRDPQWQVEEGRRLFQEIVWYLEQRPLSDYVDTLTPRLVRVREGIAAGELALAQQHHQLGDLEIGLARAQYVIDYYSRTQAAADAAQWLIQMNSNSGSSRRTQEILR